MTFVWKITCRRLQSSGALARFAEAAITEQERREIDAHLARCPACQASVTDALAVASLLQSVRPSAASTSLAASGNLWAKLESDISQTPQDTPAVTSVSRPAPASVPRLQRFGHWLATPGAMPFGTVAAAAVVGMIGLVVYERTGGFPADPPAASITAMEDSDLTEINIVPTPSSPWPSAAGARKKSTARARVAPASVAAAPEIKTPVIAPIKQKASVRQAPVSLRIAVRSLPSSPSRPSAPRARVAHVADNDATAFYFVAAPAPVKPRISAAAPTPAAPTPAAPTPAAPAPAAPEPTMMANEWNRTAMADRANGNALPTVPGGGFGGGVAAEGLATSAGTGEPPLAFGDTTYKKANPEPRPLPMMEARVTPVPLAVTAQRDAATLDSGESNAEDLQEVPAVRSLIDLALQQRRQRSLFSYATR